MKNSTPESHVLLKNEYNRSLSFFFLLLGVLIYFSDDTFLLGTREASGMVMVLKLGLYSSITVLSALVVRKFKLADAIVLLMPLFFVIVTIVFNFDFRGGYFYQLIVIIMAFMVSRLLNLKEFFQVFTLIIYWLGLISLFTTVIAYIFPQLIALFPTEVNTAGREAHNLFLSIVFEHNGVIRNTSIFREPGVFMVYLNLAIIGQLFILERTNKKQVLVFFICLLTAASTAGIFVAGVIVIAALLSTNSILSIKQKKYLLLSSVLIVIFLVYNSAQSSLLFDKLNTDSSSNISTLARVSSLFIPIQLFLDSPFWGVGITGFDSMYESKALQLFGLPMSAKGLATNSVTNIFATYGLFFGAFVGLAIVRFAYLLKSGTLTTFALILGIFAMYSNEDMRYSWLFFTVIFYGYSKVKENEFGTN